MNAFPMFMQKILGYVKPYYYGGNSTLNEADQNSVCSEHDCAHSVHDDVSSSLSDKTDIIYPFDVSNEPPPLNDQDLLSKLNPIRVEAEINSSDSQDTRVKSAPISSSRKSNSRLSGRGSRKSSMSNPKKHDVDRGTSSDSSLAFCPPTLYKLANSKLLNVKESDTNHRQKSSHRSIFTQTNPIRDEKCSGDHVRTMSSPKHRSSRNEIAFLEEGIPTPVAVCQKFSMCQAARNPMYSLDSIVYGELVVVGCDGVVPDHLLGQMKSKYVLRKRSKSNGLIEANDSCFEDALSADIFRCSNRRSVCFSLYDSRSVVVEYVPDSSTDMFQIGRYEKPPIDIRVMNLRHTEETRNGVSRFACRIVAQRYGRQVARIYASAFDIKGNIFLGEGAVTCLRDGKLDGFTTNGVMIAHPSSDPSKRTIPTWREVSVSGYVYPLRTPHLENRKRPRLLDESNILLDGTLIDLCGITLLWRTPEGLIRTPSLEYLKKFQAILDDLAPNCSVVPYSGGCAWPKQRMKKEAYVYLSCGHVVGLTMCNKPNTWEGWSCPVCRCICPVARLKVGMEPSLYADRELPSHVFRPCGHVASLKTVRYWSALKLPNERTLQGGICPFCGIKLNFITQYIKLVFPKTSEFISDGE